MTKHATAPKNGNICVFGASWCGYTVKQLDALKTDLGDHYTKGVHYIDCAKEENKTNSVCQSIRGYPQTVVLEGDCDTLSSIDKLPEEARRFEGYVEHEIKEAFDHICGVASPPSGEVD